MCQIFAGQAASRYAYETRSMRINGHSTSIRLEAAFWDVLEGIAAHDGLTVPQFVATLHDEVVELNGTAGNFTSLLRCACLVHLQRSADMRTAFAAE